MRNKKGKMLVYHAGHITPPSSTDLRREMINELYWRAVGEDGDLFAGERVEEQCRGLSLSELSRWVGRAL